MVTETKKRAPPAGAATLREGVTQAIRDATLAEIANEGVGRLSVDAVAKRAGVGKAAIYRRWPTKEAMLEAILLESGLQVAGAPDSGSLHDDVAHYLREAVTLLTDPAHARLLPHLYAEMATNSSLGAAIRKALHRLKRQSVEKIISRAISRGELPNSYDVDLALDVLAGPLYWHLMIMQKEINDAYLERLLHTTVAGLKAAAAKKSSKKPVSKQATKRRRP